MSYRNNHAAELALFHFLFLELPALLLTLQGSSKPSKVMSLKAGLSLLLPAPSSIFGTALLHFHLDSFGHGKYLSCHFYSSEPDPEIQHLISVQSQHYSASAMLQEQELDVGMITTGPEHAGC